MQGSLARNRADFAAACCAYGACLAIAREPEAGGRYADLGCSSSAMIGLGQMAAEEGRE